MKYSLLGPFIFEHLKNTENFMLLSIWQQMELVSYDIDQGIMTFEIPKSLSFHMEYIAATKKEWQPLIEQLIKKRLTFVIKTSS